MTDRSTGQNKRHPRLRWRFAGILGLLAMTALGIIPLTLAIIYSRQADTTAIDIAGRQRMLLERHMKEVLLASQGAEALHEKTRETLRHHLTVLEQGGPITSALLRNRTITLPGAPTAEIKTLFETQRQLLESFLIKSDGFIHLPPPASGYDAALSELLADNTRLLEIANEAVLLWARESESSVIRLIRWETAFVGLVIVTGAWLAWRLARSEKELRQSEEKTLDALRQSDAVKSSLLSSVSHELRTPLTAIKTMLFGLQHHGSDDPTAARLRDDFLENIHRELDYLNRLVTNLLDMSRIEAGTMTAHNQDWHLLDELVEGAVRRVGTDLQSRPLEILLASNLPPIFVDALEIQLMLTNLLDNAVKYSPPMSGIRLAASLAGDMVEIRVENEGPLLTPQDRLHLFERFYRTSDAKLRSIPGTGLGLAICKAVVEAHGGTIVVDSEDGRPITFVVRVPSAGPASSAMPVAITSARYEERPT